MLCLPLVKQGNLVGALYLEKNLAPCVFTSAKLAVLKLLASQAAISPENVRLYDELRRENSERRRALAERERLEQQLRQAAKMEGIGRLAGGIAHDFNNILGAILGYGELMQSSLREDTAVRRQVDQVMQAGARGKALVDRILAFSRSGMGERVPLHVQLVVEETLGLLAASLPADVGLERRLDAADAAVMGDATQFHQVVMNLCTNAVHAMEGSGLLTVVLERVDLGERCLLSHGTLPAGRYIRLSVSDTGSGIPPAVFERMFDPFFTTKRVGDGTGLGLALVHGIVADVGGAIDVATQVGVGTTFSISLPTSDKTPALSPNVAGQVPRGHGETLTDETMPDLTGIELARELRQLRPGISTILMTRVQQYAVERTRACRRDHRRAPQTARPPRYRCTGRACAAGAALAHGHSFRRRSRSEFRDQGNASHHQQATRTAPDRGGMFLKAEPAEVIGENGK